MLEVIVKRGRERSLRGRHPWLLSGSVASVQRLDAPDEPESGAWTRVVSADGELLAHGHYSPASSIRVRLLGFGADASASDDLRPAIARAIARRHEDPLLRGTNALRLVNAEGDGLPGLVVDRFSDVVVARLTSAGMVARRAEIASILQQLSEAPIGYERADGQAARREGVAAHQGVLWGSEPPETLEIFEGDRRYDVDVVGGQKTGFYLDQRDARDLVQKLAMGRRTLDGFSYTGGFAVAAALGGATSVTLVDASGPALERASNHLARNAPDCPAELQRGDAFAFMRETENEPFDLLILDPPPLARHKGDLRKASRALKDLVLHALRHASPEALLLVFACSHHIDMDLLRKIVFGASVDAGRSLQCLREIGAPVDHPFSLDHPEGEYLRGLLLRASA